MLTHRQALRALASKKRASTKAWWLGFRTHEAWPQLWPKDNARISGYLRYRDPRWRLWVLPSHCKACLCPSHGCGCCLWCLVGRHRSLTAAVALDHHALWLWTQGRVARFKLWPLRRLLALETPLEKATAPPLVRDCSGGLSGYLGSSPLLWETQRELVPRPYLLALRRGEAARFKEQPALAAALRPSSD